MKKKWIALGTAMILAAMLAIPAIAANTFQEKEARLRPDFTIVLDGTEKNFKRADGSAAYALVYEDSTYLPLRAIGETMSKNVIWNEETKTITLEGKRTAENSSNQAIAGTPQEVSVQVRKDFTIVIDGKEQIFRTSAGKAIYPLLYDGSTYLPLRAIGQIMQKEVTWDNATKTITLLSNNYTVTDADSFAVSGKNTVTDLDGLAKTEQMDPAADIGLEKAKAIALADAGVKESEAFFSAQKTDYDDGKKQYEVEFYYDGAEYDYEIDAATGKITSFDKDFEGKRSAETTVRSKEITSEEAKAIALRHAGLTEAQVQKLKVKRDKDDGIVQYDVEFEQGYIEYDYEINAETGEILKAEKDFDD